jgi:cytoskeletal protein CcmA (bactofilin family)
MSFGKTGKEGTATGSPVNSVPFVSLADSAGAAKVEAFLGKGTKVNGVLSFSGPVEIEGEVEGELRAPEKLTIGESATIKAKVTGGEIIVKGVVNGDLHASKKLSLKKPAKVYGNIFCSILSIEEGVIFEGKCDMKASDSTKSGTTLEKGGASVNS